MPAREHLGMAEHAEQLGDVVFDERRETDEPADQGPINGSEGGHVASLPRTGDIFRHCDKTHMMATAGLRERKVGEHGSS